MQFHDWLLVMWSFPSSHMIYLLVFRAILKFLTCTLIISFTFLPLSMQATVNRMSFNVIMELVYLKPIHAIDMMIVEITVTNIHHSVV